MPGVPLGRSVQRSALICTYTVTLSCQDPSADRIAPGQQLLTVLLRLQAIECTRIDGISSASGG